MAKEALQTNSFTKEARPLIASAGVFGVGRFGQARFGKFDIVYPKEVLPTGSQTKEELTNTIV